MVVNVEAGLPRALGFAGELNQIWVNLIDNALDAVPDGGRVEVLAKREGLPERVVVRVVDNGAGIPEAIRARIFDPFFTTKPVGSGTGLWASTSSGAWSATTTAQSPSSRSRAGRNSA